MFLAKLQRGLPLRLRQKNTENRHILMIFCLNGSDKTRRKFARKAARIKMNTFLKSGINLDLSDILLNFSNSLVKS